MSGSSNPLKQTFLKHVSKYLFKHSGRIVTTDVLASLVAEAWPDAFITVNIMASFKKTGVYPLNPGEVTDRQLAPSKAFCLTSTASNPGRDEASKLCLFSKEQEALYQR